MVPVSKLFKMDRNMTISMEKFQKFKNTYATVLSVLFYFCLAAIFLNGTFFCLIGSALRKKTVSRKRYSFLLNLTASSITVNVGLAILSNAHRKFDQGAWVGR